MRAAQTLIAILTLVLALAGCVQHEAISQTPRTPQTPHAQPTPFELQFGVKYPVVVVRVVDGDTIDVRLPNGAVERVRMLGVDTPETTAEKNRPNEYDGITDLDCSDIPYRNFRVLPPDPHNFDGDGDGIGCES